ncbi:hypothetical protein NQ317_008392 [Molorchus minor]|uniref:Uncharacterized protein n=1 Tax=Molorchus minor TaxID=1323400 RepID=A0ABQ9K683_9CUCU|nr:hypothetical protein NQ317_008392 [Molorchus minor]
MVNPGHRFLISDKSMVVKQHAINRNSSKARKLTNMGLFLVLLLLLQLNFLFCKPIDSIAPQNTFYNALQENCSLIKKIENFNNQEVFTNCKDYAEINKTQRFMESTENDILCLLYFDTFTSFCIELEKQVTVSANKIKLPVDTFLPKLDDYTIDKVCNNLSLFPAGKIFQHNITNIIRNSGQCNRLCSTYEGSLEPRCGFAHYFANINVTKLVDETKTLADTKTVQEIKTQQIIKNITKTNPDMSNTAHKQLDTPLRGLPNKNKTNAEDQNSPGAPAPAALPGESQPSLVVKPVVVENPDDAHPNKDISPGKEPMTEVHKSESAANNAGGKPNSIGNEIVESKGANSQIQNSKSADQAEVNKADQETAQKPPSDMDANEGKQDDDSATLEPNDILPEDSIDDGDNEMDIEAKESKETLRQRKNKKEPKNKKADTVDSYQDPPPISYQTSENIDGESYFFSYFMAICVLFVLGYVGYHNRQRVMALVVEGKRGKRQYRGRRPNSANYHKLDSNMEEAISSSCNKNSSHVIY